VLERLRDEIVECHVDEPVIAGVGCGAMLAAMERTRRPIPSW
jgi:hypothetical protein